MPARTDLQQAKHVFQAVILTVLVDGNAENAEAKAVAAIRADIPQIAALPDIGEIGRELHERFRHIGLEPTARAISAGLIDRDYKELAFRLCAKVMQADGETEMEEAELLGIFQELFSFSADDVKRLLTGGS